MHLQAKDIGRRKMHHKKNRSVIAKLIIAGVLLAAAFTLRIAARGIDGFSDSFAEYVNPIMVETLGRITSPPDFPVVEILIYALLLDIVIRVTILAAAAIKKRPGAGRRWARFVTNWTVLVSLIFLLFEAGEDVYFYCTPFSEKIGVGRGSYSTEELTAVCRMLAAESNALAGDVARDADGYMTVSDHSEERVSSAMKSLGAVYPSLSGYYARPKGVIFSYLMSVTNMAGIYSAYTSEANYNRDMPDYNKPFTMSHELAHTHGVLPENEANFVAYLNCMHSDQADIRYAGALTGWIYCGNELYKRDYDAWQEIASGLDTRVNRDLEANTAFWNKYKGSVSKKAASFNDSYLKNHGQTDGTESYNKVADLIISYEMQK